MNRRKVVRVVKVEPLEGRRLSLTFDDGTAGVADVSQILIGPVFEEIRREDEQFVRVGLDGYGGISWPNGADLDAWVLHELTVSESAAS